MPNRFDSDVSEKENIVSLSQGNPGAIDVLTQIATEFSPKQQELFKSIDEMNLYGSRIWIGYADFCNENIIQFVECIEENSGQFVDFVEKNRSDDGLPVKQQ